MITQDDLIERFGAEEMAALSDHERGTTLNPAVIARAIADAEAEVASYLAPVGLAHITPPKALVIKACDIARYYLHQDGAEGVVKERYEYALRWLKDVMRNPAMLTGMGDTSPAAPASAVEVRPNVIPEKPWRL